jgi:Xaa-Pro aminopeptidase
MSQIDEARMQRERMARAREALRRHGLAAALLFDPVNVRYVAVPGPFAVFNLHVAFRWALVPVESEPVEFQALRLTMPTNQDVKLEEQVMIGADGPEMLSEAPYDERLLG